MAVQPPRRLLVPTALSLYDRLSREALSYAWTRAEVSATEREHPELVIERDGNILTAVRQGVASLAYSFCGDREFIAEFPGMFAALLPRIRTAFGADTVRFRLTHGSSRTAIEPILRNLSFKQERPTWLGFSLAKATLLPKLEAPKGVRFRDGGADDIDEIIRIDREAFPDTPMLASRLRAFATEDQVLIASAGRETAGYAMFSNAGDSGGYMTILAVADEFRGRGVGAALTARVAKRVFAEGATHLDLKTDETNGDAIRLYSRLGFRHVESGRDYERPTDPKVIARLKKQSESTMVRFGGWR
jgi:ribosomal protein S18 acetylase RimI-like enzyme